ncbi:MAG: hypothetical protein U5J98_06105 [Halobacteriales archaeon]|nr:hypothetical protein [Halobacteriales archaeon]
MKAFTEADVLIVGITEGEGRRSVTFGALVMTDGTRYVGRVGSGFSEDELESIAETVRPTDQRRVSPARSVSHIRPWNRSWPQ